MTTTEARDEIRDLLARYTWYFDTGRGEDWASLFTDDGQLVVGDGPPVAGRAALEEMAANVKPGSMHHFIVNPAIEVDGDRATCHCSLLLSQGQPPTFTMAGRYEDELARVDGRWRFRRRTVTLDL